MGGVIWLAAGGILYTAGVVFYVLDDKMKHAHGIWHLFVWVGVFLNLFVCFCMWPEGLPEAKA